MFKRKLDGAVDGSLADQKFVNLIRLYVTCENSGGLHLVEPNLTVGRLADKIWARFEILKLFVDRNIRFSTLFSQGTALFQQL